MLNGSLRSNRSKNTNSHKIEIQNLIISRFPIVSSIFSDMDTEGRMDDIIGIKAVIGANININNMLVSFYSTELSKDITIANINNMNLRKKETDKLLAVIEENESTVTAKNVDNDKVVKNIHIINGSINIDYYNDNDVSEEFNSFITRTNCVDIYKGKNNNKIGYTNTEKQRVDYSFIKLTNDIFTNKKWKKEFENVKNDHSLFKFIFKRYEVYFIDSYVREDINVTNSTANFPVETAFIIKDYS